MGCAPDEERVVGSMSGLGGVLGGWFDVNDGIREDFL